MEKQRRYEIRIEGELSEGWTAWFDGLAIRQDSGGETILSGLFVDQAALFGALAKIQALNLTLIAVNRSSTEEENR